MTVRSSVAPARASGRTLAPSSWADTVVLVRIASRSASSSDRCDTNSSSGSWSRSWYSARTWASFSARASATSWLDVGRADVGGVALVGEPYGAAWLGVCAGQTGNQRGGVRVLLRADQQPHARADMKHGHAVNPWALGRGMYSRTPTATIELVSPFASAITVQASAFP